jgi:hypothetical protein
MASATLNNYSEFGPNWAVWDDLLKDGAVDMELVKLAGIPTNAGGTVTGDWYDPGYNGSGFNILTATQGLTLFYYGWDSEGNRLWLVSDIGPRQIALGTSITLNMSQTNGGYYITPANPSTLSSWGTLQINFSTCTQGTATLTGQDGSTVTLGNLQMIAGVRGAPGC